MHALHTAAAVAPVGGQQWRRLTAGRKPGPWPVPRGQYDSTTASSQHAGATAGHVRPPRIRVRLSLLRAARRGPPDRCAQVGGHVADTGVPSPAATATTTVVATSDATAAAAAVHRPAHVVLAVGRNAPRVAQGPRPVPGPVRVTADAASTAAAAVASRFANAPSATATAATVAATTTTAAESVRQLRFRDGDHRHRRGLVDQREVPVAHRPAGRQTGQTSDSQGHWHHTGAAQLENRGRRTAGP